MDCGGDAHAHIAASAACGPDYFNKPLFERERRARFLARVAAAVAGLAGEPDGVALQRAVVAELGKADLPGVGIGAEEVLARAGVAAGDGVSPPAAVAAGVYTLRLADAVNGAPAMGHLGCHRYHAKDTRDGASVYAMVHASPGDRGCKWHIAPVGDAGAFTIRLANAPNDEPAKGFLSCHKHHPKDTRDAHSVFAMVHAAPGDVGCKWLISPADAAGAVSIRLADAANDAPAKGFLSCHKYHPGDTRDDASVYAMVLAAPVNVGCKWVLTRQPDE
jgi:hypothetical protein